jgi:hypothetical protein
MVLSGRKGMDIMIAPMQFFANLGEFVDRQWSAQDYREEAFPDVAYSALEEMPPGRRFSVRDVAAAALLDDPMPFQFDLNAEFGQPPFTVYRTDRFHIDILFWVDGVPDIHQHSFSGAFHVLAGSSLHTQWHFTPREKIATGLLIGDVEFLDAEVLSPGDTRHIVAGRTFVHTTFHLSKASVSVVIRTRREAAHMPQYAYLPPCLAHDPFEIPAAVRRRMQVLRMLARADKRLELNELMRQVLEKCDTFTAFYLLREAHGLLRDVGDREALFAAAARRHGSFVKSIRPALEEAERGRRIAALRKRISNQDLQFFLALLLNIPKKEVVNRLISERYPGRPVEDRIIGWLEQLAYMKMVRLTMEHPLKLTLAALLRGDAAADAAPTIAEAYRELGSDYTAEEFIQLWNRLRHWWLLAPIMPQASSWEALSELQIATCTK